MPNTPIFTNGPCPLELIGRAPWPATSRARTCRASRPGPGDPGRRTAPRHQLGPGLCPARPISAPTPATARPTTPTPRSRNTRRSRATRLVNLRAGFRSDNGWEAFVWVKNALDEDYLQFVTVQAGNSGLVIGTPGDPRTFGLTLRANTEVRRPDEVRERAPLKDLGQGVAAFQQDEADAAGRDIHAVLAGLEPGARGAGRQGQRPIHGADDVGDGDFRRRSRQGIAARAPARADQQPVPLQPQHHRLQILPGRGDGLGDLGDGGGLSDGGRRAPSSPASHSGPYQTASRPPAGSRRVLPVQHDLARLARLHGLEALAKCE
jgi:hypothetical protein